MNAANFHPLLQGWFDNKYLSPTDVQQRAWPRIATGEHLLITAPTGSGKTLTAFLWSINRFVTGELATGTTRILYISPLKALNNDIQRNLITPLAEIRQHFEDAGQSFPQIRVQTRSGDTDQGERRRMVRQPPEILITTPESLNLMLSSASGQSMLHNIDTVILDEIHGVVGDKRGVYLMTAVERLVPMSGEFQRIALSATVNPLETVADTVAGYLRDRESYTKREVGIVRSNAEKVYDITVRYPESAATRGVDDELWDALVPDFVERIKQNRSTLLFVNSRAICEKITHKINNYAQHTLAYAHHGSLARDIRTDVEHRLKEGTLAAIVATSTLEMGIDIGALDEVILIQSPDSISSSIQRIGRAGHDVGAVSHCTVYPTHAQDFIEAAVLARAVLDADIEPIRTIECPLDVLSQIVISMTGTSAWDIDELYREIRRSTAYHRLSRRQFDLVVSMLSGRYADNHIRELRPKVIIDRQENTIEARKGALMTLYLSGGVIPDRGYFQLRHEDSNARIGELDEEFVWEANVGQVFSFGTQHWQVRKITHNDVVVGPGKPTTVAPPFWKSEPLSRSFHYAERVAGFLEHANDQLDDPAFADYLVSDHRVEPPVAEQIISYLKRQREHTRCALPHRHHLLVEKVKTGPGGAAGQQMVLHTMWGARVNRPLAMALEASWQQRFGEQPEVFVTNESLVIQLPHEMTATELLQMVSSENIEQLLRQRLEGAGFFGARFRENAGRALLLSKSRFNERKPLWMSRLQSQKLLDSVMKFHDFPILLETWRTCLHDEFDLHSLRQVLVEIETNEIVIEEINTQTPSPFAQSVAWGQINTYMYMDDQPKSSKTSNLGADLLAEVVFTPELRPTLPIGLVEEFEQRQHRLAPGYAPDSLRDLIEWVKERSFIPAVEWAAMISDMDGTDTSKLTSISNGNAEMIVASDDARHVSGTLAEGGDESLGTLISNWMQHYGPITQQRIQHLLGVPTERLGTVLQLLVDDGTVVFGPLTEGIEETQWCDANNYEFLLRLLRTRHRTSFEPLEIDRLVPFLFQWQTAETGERDDVDRLFDAMTQLRCYPAPAEQWESEFLPARLPGYQTRTLDLLFQEGDMMWLGTGPKQATFCFSEDIDLLHEEVPKVTASLPADTGRFDFGNLLDTSGLTAAELTEELWHDVWQSAISNDAVSTLRKGIEQGFSTPDLSTSSSGRSRRIRRGGFNQWRNAIPFSGNWFRVPYSTAEIDAVERDETSRERVRLLLDRYGIVFRELVAREAEPFRWRAIFRSLRLMELAGEVFSGYFFKGITGPQFISPTALRRLQRLRVDETIFWLNATDPLSPCGLGLEGLSNLPRRIPSNYLVFHGTRVVLVIERQGKVLDIRVPPNDPNLPKYLDVLRHLAYRSFAPKRKLNIETINDEPATISAYADVLDDAFDLIRDFQSLYIQRQL
jgi:ATP-dependent helicase Lhr and Lhr-like helicase